MLLTFMKGKQRLLVVLFLLLLGACKQSEFYDKSKLLDSEKNPTANSETGTDNGADNGNENGDRTGTENNPGTTASSNPGEENANANIPDALIPSIATNPNVGTTIPGPLNLPVAVNPPDTAVPVSALPDAPIIPIANTPTTPPTPLTPPTATILLNDRKEFFTQNSFKDGDVDILWMIDNSGSMANKQKRLSESLGIFIDKFLNKNINFKMAITTTDGTSQYNGKMIGDANKLTSTYLKTVGKTQFMSYFQSIVKVGTNGSGTEQGLKTSSTFFDRYASSFLRADANLAIVEISDEEDQSEKAVSLYLDKFYALKASKGMIKIYSVVTEVLPDNHSLSDSIGNRYVQASTITGGISSEIKSDFSTTLLDIGTSIVGLVDSFSLAEAPYNNAVKVYVNKLLVTTGWTYDDKSHSVKFLPTAVPKEGSLVEIEYQVKATVLGAI